MAASGAWWWARRAPSQAPARRRQQRVNRQQRKVREDGMGAIVGNWYAIVATSCVPAVPHILMYLVILWQTSRRKTHVLHDLGLCLLLLAHILQVSAAISKRV